VFENSVTMIIFGSKREKVIGREGGREGQEKIA
jgi:hypothetical protein